MNKSSIIHWGPSAWNYLHTCSFAYSEFPNDTNREEMYNFLIYFAKVIPCHRCRHDFVKYLNEQLPEKMKSDHFSSKHKLIHFLIDAHNYVNLKLGKRVYSYKEVYYMYTKNPDKISTQQIFICIILIITLLILIYTSFFKRKCDKICKNIPQNQ